MSDVSLLVAVALAGGIGSALRHLVDNALPASLRERYPWGTTLVNVTGSFALGLLAGVAVAPGTVRAVIGSGLIGGYTTFSTASLETVRLTRERRRWAAFANGAGMLAACVLASTTGMVVAPG